MLEKRFNVMEVEEQIALLPLAEQERVFSLHRIKEEPLKRSFDILFSLAVLVFLSPLFLFIALAIKVNSPGPIFYKPDRVARGGGRFRCWKFRTMFAEADKKLALLLARDSELREEWRTYYKLKNDPRVTPIGRFLRRTSLDELPQFWNVLKGDLSVVGPRPWEVEQVMSLGESAEKILSVRPGITGLWQTSGRNLLSYKERIQLEERYVESRHFLMDIKIILKTVVQMLFSKGAY